MNKLISLKSNEHINIVNNINNFNTPEKIYIPANFIDKEVKINDYIYKNTYFKDFIISISGYISGVENIYLNKKNIEALVVTNDFKENILKKNKKIKIKTKEELELLLKNNHLEKLLKKINKIESINNLIISSIDEEIYSVKEFIRLANNYREILDTIDLLINIFNLNNAQIVAKNTNFKSIKNVKSIIGTYPNIKITLAPDKYLIGQKNFLCEYLNILENNTLLLTTNEIYMIYSVLNGIEVNETILTISGNALDKGIVINTKLGVSLKELLKEYIKIDLKNYEIYINGYLMGYKLDNNADIVITNDIQFIVINIKEDIKVSECINCGACNKICPMNINVKKCFINKLNHKKCIGCGLCNYICPANINLKEIVKSDKIEENN